MRGGEEENVSFLVVFGWIGFIDLGNFKVEMWMWELFSSKNF